VSVIFDSSALLALIKQERGADVVAQALSDGVVSPVTFAETLSKAALLGHDPAAAEERLLRAGLTVAVLSLDDLRAVIRLHPFARRDVSLADRFGLALAMERKLPILTADRPWRDLGLPVELRYIR
jgi:PIN domain nuclease of toxin-antitoxin system